jgi:hypothetical protein
MPKSSSGKAINIKVLRLLRDTKPLADECCDSYYERFVLSHYRVLKAARKELLQMLARQEQLKSEITLADTDEDITAKLSELEELYVDVAASRNLLRLFNLFPEKKPVRRGGFFI